jgi:hypothetical protein
MDREPSCSQPQLPKVALPLTRQAGPVAYAWPSIQYRTEELIFTRQPKLKGVCELPLRWRQHPVPGLLPLVSEVLSGYKQGHWISGLIPEADCPTRVVTK